MSDLPKVSIVIPAYLESNRAYLEACLDSVANLDYPKDKLDVVIISPWVRPEAFAQARGFTVVRNDKRANSFSGSINTGVDWADADSEHILILSDDTIITRDALKALVTTAQGSRSILCALSNCDLYWKYHLILPHVYPKRFYRLEEVNTNELMQAKSLYGAGVILTDVLCFYAVLIPRAVWREVGDLDECYNMGYEDTDYCMRARRAGAHLGIVLNAIIWHAGGATGDVITQEMRDKNLRTFKEKWEKPDLSTKDEGVK